MKKLMFVAAVTAMSMVGFATNLKNGDSVAFMGDSITQQGWGTGGYVRMCEAAFKANGLDVKIIPAGISGHKSPDMLARLKRDVLDKKPVYMTLSCGVNDVWHQDNNRGVLLPAYKENITKIIDTAQAAGVKVVVLTSTMIYEDVNNVRNQKLASYNKFLREIAKEKGCKLVDLNAEMQRQVAAFRAATGSNQNYLTSDGVHMAFLGNRMMATSILKDGFDFTADELAKSDEAIKRIKVYVRMPDGLMTGEQYLSFVDDAIKAKRSPTNYIQHRMGHAINEALGKESEKQMNPSQKPPRK